MIVVLQPTSPFRNSVHIEAALKTYENSKAHSLVSICESQKSPYWMFSLEDDGALEPILYGKNQFSRRQELPKTYCLNGAIYVVDVELFLKNKINDNSVCKKSVQNKTNNFIMLLKHL